MLWSPVEMLQLQVSEVVFVGGDFIHPGVDHPSEDLEGARAERRFVVDSESGSAAPFH